LLRLASRGMGAAERPGRLARRGAGLTRPTRSSRSSSSARLPRLTACLVGAPADGGLVGRRGQRRRQRRRRWSCPGPCRWFPSPIGRWRLISRRGELVHSEQHAHQCPADERALQHPEDARCRWQRRGRWRGRGSPAGPACFPIPPWRREALGERGPDLRLRFVGKLVGLPCAQHRSLEPRRLGSWLEQPHRIAHGFPPTRAGSKRRRACSISRAWLNACRPSLSRE
jgi:hypothetical protein